MEKLKEYIPHAIITTILIGFFSWVYYVAFWTPIIKEGEIWRWTLGDSDNPFENVRVIDYQVIDVEGDYVKSINLKDSTISIDNTRLFKQMELISHNKTIIIYLSDKN